MNRHPTGTSDECDICEGFTRFWLMFYSRGFHKLDEIASNANVGIRGFTTWKQKNQWQYPIFLLFIQTVFNVNFTENERKL